NEHKHKRKRGTRSILTPCARIPSLSPRRLAVSAGLSLTEVEDWLTAGGDGERPMPEAHRLRKAAEVLGDDGAEILRRYGYVEAASALEKQLETERLRSSKPFWWNENVLRYR